MNEPKYDVGDWVSFYYGGSTFISEIKYRNKSLGTWHYYTSAGVVSEDEILEARKAK